MKLRNKPTTKLLSLLKVRKELAVKLGVSLFDFLQKIMFGSLSVSLNQWSSSHWFVHEGCISFQPFCDLSFGSVDKLDIIRTG